MKRVPALLLCAFAVQALAQSYPAKPVRVIVPYPPGGGNDILGRQSDIVTRFKQLSTEPVGNSPEEFAAFVRAELAKYARIIKGAGIKLD